MTIITWKGGTDTWANPLAWSPATVPTTLDVASIAGNAAGVITVGQPAAAQEVDLAPQTKTTLLVSSDLSVSGEVRVSSGTFELGAGGRLIGGTVEPEGGVVVASGGTAEHVVWLAPFGDGLVIDPDTAVVTALVLASGSVSVAGALTLSRGTYGTSLTLASFGQAVAPSLAVTAGASATLSATTTFTGVKPNALPGTLPGTVGALIGGAGLLVNAGEFDVSLPGGAYGGLTIAGSVRNDGVINLAPVTVNNYQQTFPVARHGKTPPSSVTLSWTYVLPDHVTIAGGKFANTGQVVGAGAVIVIGGGAAPTTFLNSGTITLSDTTTEQPNLSGPVPSIGTGDLPGSIEIKAGVAFTNTGLIAAGNIVFDGDVTLASLGTLQGNVVFDGTLDLGDGTLDVTGLPSSVFTPLGLVKNGSLIGGGTQLHLGSATLQNVLVVAAPSDILHDVVAGTVTLDSNTLELRYSTAASIDGPFALVVTGTGDVIAATAQGTLSFGAATTISEQVPGSKLTLGGPGATAFDGVASLVGSTLQTGTLTGSGTISLAGGSELTIGALGLDANLTIAFAGGHNVLLLPSAVEHGLLGLTLKGLSPGDLIDFAAVSSASGTVFAQAGANIQSDQMFVLGASGDKATVGVAGNTAALTFSVTPDTSGGSLVTVACFRHGTRVATPAGERAVETLRIGDLVNTAAEPCPIRWLGHRAYHAALVARQRQLRPVRIRAGALGGGLPRRDLDLSPLHALLVDGALVPAASIVNRRTIVRAPVADTAYVHIELAQPGLVFAEGTPAETFVDCDSRAMFANAATFAELYPGATPPAWRFAAPRLEGGWRLAALRSRLLPGRPGVANELRGALDTRAGGVLEGWAADGSGAVELEVVAGAKQVGCVVANRYRIDLDHAGFVEPAAGFRAELPTLPPEVLATVTVRRLSDGATLGR